MEIPATPTYKVDVTTRVFTTDGNRFLEVSTEDDGYVAQITTTGSDQPFDSNLKEMRRVFAERRFSEKPTFEQLTTWLSLSRYYTVMPESLTQIVSLLP